MLEIAVGYVGAYLARKGLGVLGRAGADVDGAVDDALGALYEWVKARFTGQPTAELSLELLSEAPEGKPQQALVREQLASALDDEAREQLAELVRGVEAARPPGVTLTGLARAEDLSGLQVGVDVESPADGPLTAHGTATARTVRSGGINAGVRYRGGPGTS